jgi:hypothetical protein
MGLHSLLQGWLYVYLTNILIVVYVTSYATAGVMLLKACVAGESLVGEY